MNTPFASGATNCASLYDIDLRTRAGLRTPNLPLFCVFIAASTYRTAAASRALHCRLARPNHPTCHPTTFGILRNVL